MSEWPPDKRNHSSLIGSSPLLIMLCYVIFQAQIVDCTLQSPMMVMFDDDDDDADAYKETALNGERYPRGTF